MRIVSLAERSLGLQLVQFQVDQPGQVTFEAWLEVANAGLDVVQIQPSLGVWRTAESRKRLAIASAAELQLDGQTLEPAGQVHLTRIWTWDAQPEQVITFWRMVSFARGDNRNQPLAQVASQALARAVNSSPMQVLAAHEQAWADRWSESDVRVEGDEFAQRALRFAVYHLISAANPDDERVSIGARALTGDAYLGHVFWDTENYLLPFYTFTWPGRPRALLMYRYHTLVPHGRRPPPGLQGRAIRLGVGRHRRRDHARDDRRPRWSAPFAVLCGLLEHHISADIAYAVWQYWLVTQDVPFLLEAGAEIILETARFWASRAQLEADGRYHIRGVIGPDEYHEYVDDNAYTNVMAQWNLERGLDVAALVAESWPAAWRTLSGHLALDEVQLALWRDVADRLVTGLDSATGRIEQFQGYFGLEDIDLTQYAGRTVPMDVVLGRERTQGSQIVKQADLVMLLALLPERFDHLVQETNFSTTNRVQATAAR